MPAHIKPWIRLSVITQYTHMHSHTYIYLHSHICTSHTYAHNLTQVFTCISTHSHIISQIISNKPWQCVIDMCITHTLMHIHTHTYTDAHIHRRTHAHTHTTHTPTQSPHTCIHTTHICTFTHTFIHSETTLTWFHTYTLTHALINVYTTESMFCLKLHSPMTFKSLHYAEVNISDWSL